MGVFNLNLVFFNCLLNQLICRHCGVQLYHYSIHQPRTWIPLSITLLFLIAFFYTFILMDRSKEMDEFAHTYKNSLFFAQFMYFVSNYGYIPSIMCYMIHYLFNGPKLINCLQESHELNHTYHRHINDRKAIILFILCIIPTYSGFFVSYFAMFLKLDWSNELMKSLFFVLATHAICVMDYFQLNSLFYGEWLIRRTLLDLRERIIVLVSNEKIYIRKLASTCERIHSLQSLPLLIYCSNYSFQMTLVFCMSFLSGNQIPDSEIFWFFIYLISVTIYFAYIIHINEESLTIFDDIMTHLRKRKHRIPIRLVQSSTEMICTYELEQYRHSFRMKLFNLTYLNLNVLFTIVLSVIGITVFILQTN